MMEEAIKLAIEKGGYTLNNVESNWLNDHALDPLFWQALGKALGWKRWTCFYHCKQSEQWGTDAECCCGWEGGGKEETWMFMAHRYLDVVLSGGDTERFWEELLGNRSSI